MRFKTREELEEVIRKVFEIDKMLPVVKPADYHSLLGKLIVIPDDERSPADVLEDINRFKSQVMSKDFDMWYVFMNGMLTKLTDRERKVIEFRAKNWGWKRIAKKFKELGLSEREMHRSTLWLFYKSGIKKLLKMDFDYEQGIDKPRKIYIDKK